MDEVRDFTHIISKYPCDFNASTAERKNEIENILNDYLNSVDAFILSNELKKHPEKTNPAVIEKLLIKLYIVFFVLDFFFVAIFCNLIRFIMFVTPKLDYYISYITEYYLILFA